jgi:chlorinating enzyme
MTMTHTPDELLQTFHQNGFVGPFDGLSLPEVQRYKSEIKQELVGTKDRSRYSNRHLDWPVVERLCLIPAVVKHLQQLMGPNLILWRTEFFAQSCQAAGLPWHCDEYRKLISDPMAHLSVHLAITEATEDSCVILLPGSHKLHSSQLIEYGFHAFENSTQNILGVPHYFRQMDSIIKPVKMLLKPGQYFIFHPSILHASDDFRARSILLGKIKYGFNPLRHRLSEKLGIAETRRQFLKSLNLLKPKQQSLETYSPAGPVRIAFTMRVTSPGITVLPAAFRGFTQGKCVLLSGVDDYNLNELAPWPS